MRRTQIQFTDEQARRLRDVAEQEGRSVSDVVRESVSEYLKHRAEVDREELKRRALAVVGKYRSDTRDVAEEHDHYLDEAYGAGR
jgi:Arc/MetJ-type ribon-helix-helix transcriptional regulator